MHRFLLHNSTIRETSERSLAAGQTGLLNGWGVFSTLRVIDGALFAYPRHWRRMERDARLLHVPMPPSPEWLEERLHWLIDANQAHNSTLRVAVIRNRGGQFEGPGIETDCDVVAFTRDLKDWGTSVRLDVAPMSRQGANEFAGTKMLSWSFNLVLLERAANNGYDEVILLDERGEVSECTSANIFAVFGDEVLTPPLSSGCLPGVTRAILLEEIRVPGVELRESPLTLDDLARADEVFVTSSTRELLPVSEIRGVTLRRDASRGVESRLAGAFRECLTNYRAAHPQPISLVSD